MAIGYVVRHVSEDGFLLLDGSHNLIEQGILPTAPVRPRSAADAARVRAAMAAPREAPAQR